MSSAFCVLIPAKIFQVEKRFPEKLHVWFIDNSPTALPYYSLITLSEFGNRPDVVDLDLPEKLYSRCHVVDWGVPIKLYTLQSLLSWLAKIYVYGEVGLLNYWSGTSSRLGYPPVTLGNFERSLFNLSSTSELPLDKVVFVQLSNYSSNKSNWGR